MIDDYSSYCPSTSVRGLTAAETLYGLFMGTFQPPIELYGFPIRLSGAAGLLSLSVSPNQQ